MSASAMDYENSHGDRYDDGGYGRDERSLSPARRDDSGRESTRRRSASPSANAQAQRASKEGDSTKNDDAINPGSNLFVTGIAPSLSDVEVSRLFEKYGVVEKCQIMRDPHTKESRCFGFVKMVTSDQADAAKEGLSGEVIEGRALNIEKARRSRPRTPTPGKYFGPPKRDGRGRFSEGYDDRRRGRPGGGFGNREDYRYRGYDHRYEDRGYRGGGYDRGGGGGYDDRGYDRGFRSYDRRDRDDGYGRSSDRRRDDRDRESGRGRGGSFDDYHGGSRYER